MDCRSKWQSSFLIKEKKHNWKGGKCHILYCGWCKKEVMVGEYRIGMYENIFCSKECISKFLSEQNSLDGNPMWKGGISFEPYSSEFNEKLKKSIKERDNYTCQLCDKPENGIPHHVHHINYEKLNSEEYNLITLCESCHGKTNSNRGYWKSFFQQMMIDRFSS